LDARLQMLAIETLKWALLAQQTRGVAGGPLFFMGFWLLSRALFDGRRDTGVSVRSHAHRLIRPRASSAFGEGGLNHARILN
jgi:hypothetical protein